LRGQGLEAIVIEHRGVVDQQGDGAGRGGDQSLGGVWLGQVLRDDDSFTAQSRHV
jgi:hypothetical protein